MERWVLKLGRLGSLRLHHWIRSDDKRAKHDHPSDFWILVIKGSYTDLGGTYSFPPISKISKRRPWSAQAKGVASVTEQMTLGTFRFRPAEHAHTVVVDPGGCWTLCWFKPNRRNWGFFVKRADGSWKWKKANKYFLENGHHPCDQP